MSFADYGDLIKGLWFMKFTLLLLTVLMNFLPSSTALVRSEPWERLKGHFQGRRIRSGQEFAAALPLEMRRNFFLNFGTDSPQGATPALPRAVVMSDDAKMVVAFEGGLHDQPEPLFLEAISFDESRPRRPVFRPHLIQIDPQNGNVRFIDDPETVFPRGHSRNCAGCHGSGDDFRLIWDSYAVWRHTYGSGFEEPGPRLVRIQNELQSWSVFQETNADRGIYQHLSQVRNAPLTSLEAKNEEITALFNRLNSLRILGQIRENPIIQQYAPEILAVLAARPTEDLSIAFSDDLKREISTSFTRHRNHISRVLEHMNQARRAAYQTALGVPKANAAEFDQIEITKYALLRFFMEKAGISMRKWPMTLAPDTFSFSGPVAPFNDLMQVFWEQVFLPKHPGTATTLGIKSTKLNLLKAHSPLWSNQVTQYSLTSPSIPQREILLALASRSLPGLFTIQNCEAKIAPGTKL